MSNIWMCHITHMNESCHTHEWVMSHMQVEGSDGELIRHKIVMLHIWMSHVTYDWVMSHVWHADERVRVSVAHIHDHITHMNESCHSYIVGRIRRRVNPPQDRHVTHMNESCHTYECVMSHMQVEGSDGELIRHKIVSVGCGVYHTSACTDDGVVFT